MSGPFTFNGIAVIYLGSNLSYFCAIFPVCSVSFLSCLSFGLIGYSIPFFFTTSVYGILSFYSLRVTLKTTNIFTFLLACFLVPPFHLCSFTFCLKSISGWLQTDCKFFPFSYICPPAIWIWCSYHQGVKNFSTSWVWTWPCGSLWSMGCQQKWKRPLEHWGSPLPAAGNPSAPAQSSLGWPPGKQGIQEKAIPAISIHGTCGSEGDLDHQAPIESAQSRGATRPTQEIRHVNYFKPLHVGMVCYVANNRYGHFQWHQQTERKSFFWKAGLELYTYVKN